MLLDSYILQCLLLQPETLCTLHVTLSYPDETAKKVMIKEGALPMSACCMHLLNASVYTRLLQNSQGASTAKT